MDWSWNLRSRKKDKLLCRRLFLVMVLGDGPKLVRPPMMGLKARPTGLGPMDGGIQ